VINTRSRKHATKRRPSYPRSPRAGRIHRPRRHDGHGADQRQSRTTATRRMIIQDSDSRIMKRSPFLLDLRGGGRTNVTRLRPPSLG